MAGAFSPSRQQFLPNIQRIGNFAAVGNGMAITADAVTSGGVSAAFPTLPVNASASDVLVVNTGTVSAFIQFGTGAAPTITIPSSGTPGNGIVVPAGNSWVLDKGIADWAAASTSSSTATVYFYQGIGS